jgi:DNA topoisomerase-2
LGTSSEEEAKEYFREMKRVTYTYDTKADEAIDLAFNKKRADDRKAWLMKYDRQEILDYTQPKVPYGDFIHKELIHFSNRDLERSINHMCDGLKESTRKILFGCMKRKLYRDEIKVAQLAAYIAEVSAYHHGEASLQQAIVGMGQNFVGTNNINLLSPNGQFGTRVMGGEDAASPRYIFTVLTHLAKIIFREEDNPTLKYLQDDGMMVEPEYYIPIVPMILINGGLGIGTGFSTNVPCHNPSDVVDLCEKVIHVIDKEVPFINTKDDIKLAITAIEKAKISEIKPWYLGFTGEITGNKKENSYLSKGVYKWVDDQTVEISELPLFEWTDNYKEKVLVRVKTPAWSKREAERRCKVRDSFQVVQCKESVPQ